MYPLQHTVLALATLLIPVLVRQRDRNGVRRIKHTVVQLLAIFVPIGLLYLLLLAIFRAPILNFLYAGRYGSASVWAVIAIGILPITTGIAALLGAALRALERPRLIFWSYLVSVVVACSIGIPITLRQGVAGAVVSLVIGELATVVVLAVLLTAVGEDVGMAWWLRNNTSVEGHNSK
jgi:O-antigen/teichoic acid export membrane protein